MVHYSDRAYSGIHACVNNEVYRKAARTDPYFDGSRVSPESSSVQWSESLFAPEVNVSSVGQKRHDDLDIGITSTGQPKGSVWERGRGEGKRKWGGERERKSSVAYIGFCPAVTNTFLHIQSERQRERRQNEDFGRGMKCKRFPISHSPGGHLLPSSVMKFGSTPESINFSTFFTFP